MSPVSPDVPGASGGGSKRTAWRMESHGAKPCGQQLLSNSNRPEGKKREKLTQLNMQWQLILRLSDVIWVLQIRIVYNTHVNM
jgi:hypothetical protein